MVIKVRTSAFEGPFDLLLHLILKQDVDLYEVRLAEIVDAYLEELSKLEACDLEVSTEFLLIASTLVELKARRLLPVESDVDLDEELALWEERDLLLARLLEAKTFKDAAVVLKELMTTASLSLPRRVGLEAPFVDLSPDPLASMTAKKLQKAFLRVASAKPTPTVDVSHIPVIKANVSVAIEELTQTLPHSGPTTFRSLTQGVDDRMEVVVRFLAMLELFKVGLIDISQTECFGDLTLSWVGADELAELPVVDDYDW